MDVRILISTAAIAAASFTHAARAEAEEERRVVVLEFDGPQPSAALVRKALLEVVSDLYEVVPYAKYRAVVLQLDIVKESMQSIAKVARKVGADAVIEGALRGRELTLAVREGKSGRVVDRFKVAIRGNGFADGVRERLVDELVDLVDWTDQLDRGGEAAIDLAAVRRADDAAAPPPPLPPEKKPTEVPARKWTVEGETTEVERKAKVKDARPPAIQVSAAVGVAATARQLSFSHQAELTDASRPMGMSGSPSAGVAFFGSADVDSLGLAADVSYKRSIGASLSYPDAGGTAQRSIALSHVGARLRVGRQVSRRISLRGGAGYNQLSYRINNKPSGLLIPDARYAYLDVGGGARLGLRDDRISLTSDLWYLFVLNASGITDDSAYGSSRFQGFGGEVGIEIAAGDTTFVRVAGTYQRIILQFNGDGRLTTGLDESSDVDVSGASDTFVGWIAMFGFRL